MKFKDLKPGDVAIVHCLDGRNRLVCICSNLDRTDPYAQLIGTNDGWNNFKDLELECTVITESILEGVKDATK